LKNHLFQKARSINRSSKNRVQEPKTRQSGTWNTDCGKQQQRQQSPLQ